MKKLSTFFHLLLIAIIGIVVYSNTFNVPFHFDDTPNIVENYKLKDLSNLWPPSESRWFGFFTFALNYYFGGLDVTGYHIVNLIIHILNAILVYWLVVLTFKTPYFLTYQKSLHCSSNPPIPPLVKGGEGGFALFSALLFVSHPIQTQAVTYIVQRFTSLATMFYLLSLVMYIKFRSQQSAISRQRSVPHPSLPHRGGRMGGGDESKLQTHRLKSVLCYLASVICAVLAMKTKEISFTLPFIIVLYEFCFFKSQNYELRTMSFKRFFCLLPFILTMLIIPLSLIGIDKPIGDVIGELREAAQETEEISRWSYLFTQFRVIVTYIRLLFLPINQNLDYDYPIYHSFFEPNVFLSFLFLLSIFGLAIYLFYRSQSKVSELRTQNPEPKIPPTRYTLHPTRLMAFGLFWFFITLSVESSIIPIRDVINEQRVYLPSVGVAVAFASTVFYYASCLVETSYALRVMRYVLPSLLIIVVISLSVVTYSRNIVWEDGVSLWEDVVVKSPQKARGHNNLGNCYALKSLTDKAIEHYQIALRLKPDYAMAYNNLGVAYYKHNQLDKAIEEFQIALGLEPNSPDAHNNIGMAYANQGMLDKAIREFQTTLRLKPDYVDAHYNLANAYKDKGWIDKAIEHYQIVLRSRPDDTMAHNNLGAVYRDKGWIDKAIEHYQIALRVKPDDAMVHNNIGTAYTDKGWIDKAIEHYQIALRVKPDYAMAHYNLANACTDKGWIDKAIEHYQIVLRLKPNYVEAYNNLGIAYYKQKRLDEAIQIFRTVLRLKPDYVDAYNNLGNAYSKKGMTEEALKQYQIALKLDPKHKTAKDNLNRILQIKR